jgi:phage gp36-like protein
MAYCTQTDIEERIGSAELVLLADHDADGTADADVITRAITDAGAFMDSFLVARYAIPISAPVPDVIESRAINITVYFLRLGRDSVTDDVRRQHRDDIAWLMRVGDGKLTLEEPPASGVKSQVQDRLFGCDKPL